MKKKHWFLLFCEWIRGSGSISKCHRSATLVISVVDFNPEPDSALYGSKTFGWIWIPIRNRNKTFWIRIQIWIQIQSISRGAKNQWSQPQIYIDYQSFFEHMYQSKILKNPFRVLFLTVCKQFKTFCLFNNNNPFQPVLPIRIRRIRMLLSLPDPDPLVRGMDPDPSIIKQK
jgi:hypothetical protein